MTKLDFPIYGTPCTRIRNNVSGMEPMRVVLLWSNLLYIICKLIVTKQMNVYITMADKETTFVHQLISWKCNALFSK